ncbi:hypothetical protein [Methylobacterium sp. Leaf466]|uniref:hypothetical protein n=1 Tax=Methylobacterium sp. Leaf466 TaxID=1736386 RepID=UPI0007020C50|nr:hypothetical protein [Methylobacterium sp. Leaf466]KQT78095.1 hypothetical protein ASG59_08830 [Methylobacterium sp. Leaf466]
MQTKKIIGEQRGTARQSTALAALLAGRKSLKVPVRMPWQERPYQQLGAASEIAQISEAALYKAEKEGALTFVRLAGRTLVETASLIEFLRRAQPWAPSDRGAAARAKRAEVARANFR